MGINRYIPSGLALTGVAATMAGVGGTVNPVIEQVSKALPPTAPAPTTSKSPTMNPGAVPPKATTSTNAVGGEIPGWLKIVGYAVLGFGAVFFGAKIVK